MSRTFGHTKRSHSGFASYRTAKGFRTTYNRVVRHLNRVRVDCAAVVNEDTIFIDRNETSAGNMYNHPGD
jgi:hypothetical protein